MRLNIGCVRDILLCVENITTPNKPALFLDVDTIKKTKFIFLNPEDIPTPKEYQKELMNKYSNEELIYHINYCLKAALIETSDYPIDSYIVIQDLTPKGHSFIENIREDTNFNKVVSIAKNAAKSITLEAVVEIASKVISDRINSFFNL